MAKRKTLYQLTEEDIEVFEAGAENANNFTDYYLRTTSSGTLVSPDQETYLPTLKEWDGLGRPEELFTLNDEEWGVVWHGETPYFRQHHGFRLIPWQVAAHHCLQKLIAVAGGYSSGKSLGIMASKLVKAATIEQYKCMCVAPSFFQAQLLYKMALQLMTGTLYEERFLMNAIIAPFPIITVGNDHVGESTIEFRSASDDGYSILSWRGDEAVIDQAELIPDIKTLRNNLGSRLVGKAPCGRPYMGIQTWLANAGPNPQFWSLYELGKSDPENCISFTVTTYDNPHNSQDDLRRLERDVGGVNEDGSVNQEVIDQWLLAKKPLTHGKHFSDSTISKGRARKLEAKMKRGRDEKRNGYIYEEDSSGIFKWFVPYEHGHSYLVIRDPGQANRPDRNSPVVMVWDISYWPEVATLVGFWWMDGNASITPFINGFTYGVTAYHAQGQCAFDSTGTQKTLDELVFEFHDLLVEGLDFSKLKMHMLNALKILLENGKLRYPYIGGIWQQLANYDLPDSKLRQDIVCCMMMSAWWLREHMTEQKDEEETEANADPGDRHGREVADRAPRSAGR